MIKRTPVLLLAMALAGCATYAPPPPPDSDCRTTGKGNRDKANPRVCVEALLHEDGSATFTVDPYMIVASGKRAQHIVFESRSGGQINVVMKQEQNPCTLDPHCLGNGDCRIRIRPVDEVQRCAYSVAVLLNNQWILLDPIVKIDTD